VSSQLQKAALHPAVIVLPLPRRDLSRSNSAIEQHGLAATLMAVRYDRGRWARQPSM
jgi:hypothetical protein